MLAWSTLHSAPSPINIIVCIMSIDPSPSVTVFRPPVQTSTTSLSVEPKGTPVSTPQPGISPGPHALTPASTPNANVDPAGLTDVSNDADAHLVDRGDEVFGLVAGCRVNILAPSSLNGSGGAQSKDYRLSLSSGYMFRSPAASRSKSGVVSEEEKRVGLVGVHLIWVGQPARGGVQAQQQQLQQQQQQQGQNQNQQGFPPIDPSLPQTPGSGGAGGSNGGTSQSPPQNPTTSQSQIHRPMADSILRDYLVLFRNLAELGRVRGVGGGTETDGELEGVLPWHVLVALRGVRGLQGVFGTLGE